jgi:tetratricopeptide (TPR) repeat protein
VRCFIALVLVVPSTPLVAPAAPPKEDRGTAEEFVEIGDQWYSVGAFDRAIDFYTRALERDPKYVPALQSRAAAHTQNGNLLNASRDYTDALALDPKDPTTWYNRAWVRDTLGFYEQALEDLNEALRLKPDFVSALVLRAYVYVEQRELDKALADLNDAMRLDPKDVHGLLNRGGVYLHKGEFEKALKDYTEAVRIEPNTAQYYRDRSNAWYGLKKYDKVLADLNEAIALDPKNPEFYRTRSWFRMTHLRDAAAAMKDAEAAVRLAPKDALALRQRAEVHIAFQKWEAARQEFDASARLLPDHPEILSGRAMLLACCPDETHRDPVQAFKDANRACELTDWKDVHALEALAASAAALGDFDGAVKWQEKALERHLNAGAIAEARHRVAVYKAKKQPVFGKPGDDKE